MPDETVPPTAQSYCPQSTGICVKIVKGRAGLARLKKIIVDAKGKD